MPHLWYTDRTRDHVPQMMQKLLKQQHELHFLINKLVKGEQTGLGDDLQGVFCDSALVETRARYPAVNVALGFTQDPTKPCSSRKQNTSPEAFGINEIFRIINYLVGDNFMTSICPGPVYRFDNIVVPLYIFLAQKPNNSCTKQLILKENPGLL